MPPGPKHLSAERGQIAKDTCGARFYPQIVRFSDGRARGAWERPAASRKAYGSGGGIKNLILVI
jgi:hypothetical protein